MGKFSRLKVQYDAFLTEMLWAEKTTEMKRK